SSDLFSRLYSPGATNAQAWYSSHGIATTRATKNANFSGTKNGEATSTAISRPPAGSLSSNGCASQPYRRSANGSRATNTSSNPATPRSSRERSSMRCWITVGPVASSIASGLVPVSVLARGRVGALAQGGGRAALLARFVQRLPGFGQAAAQVLGGDLAFQLGAHRMPLRARAPHPQPGHARGARQALGPEHQQRHQRDHQQFGKTDVEHPGVPGARRRGALA